MCRCLSTLVKLWLLLHKPHDGIQIGSAVCTEDECCSPVLCITCPWHVHVGVALDPDSYSIFPKGVAMRRALDTEGALCSQDRQERESQLRRAQTGYGARIARILPRYFAHFQPDSSRIR